MDLVVDIGNSRTHMALFEGPELIAIEHVVNGQLAGMLTGWETFLRDRPKPERVALGHVNAKVRQPFQEWVEGQFELEVQVLGENLDSGLTLEVERPEQVGIDRVANAIWARHNYPARSVVVIDLGTAITFDVVSSAGAFQGGIIAAGASTCARALADRTAQLPLVFLREPDEGPWPPPAIGRSTEGSLLSGLFWSTVGLVNTVCERIAIELEEDPIIVATGGDALEVATHCPCVARVEPECTLRGIRLALESSAQCE